MRRVATVTLIAILIIAAFLLVERSRTEVPRQPNVQQPGPGGGEQVSPSREKVGGFFPLKAGNLWQYLGEGNEYATFKREVLYAKGDRAQIKEDNGGTVSTAVFRTTDSELTRIFFRGEAYEETNYLEHEPEENVVILKAPIAVGTRWDTPNGTREIVDVNATVDAPAGKFANCLKVKVTGSNFTIFEYFKEEVGMVKREFISGDTRVTSTLESFKISPTE